MITILVLGGSADVWALVIGKAKTMVSDPRPPDYSPCSAADAGRRRCGRRCLRCAFLDHSFDPSSPPSLCPRSSFRVRLARGTKFVHPATVTQLNFVLTTVLNLDPFAPITTSQLKRTTRPILALTTLGIPIPHASPLARQGPVPFLLRAQPRASASSPPYR